MEAIDCVLAMMKLIGLSTASLAVSSVLRPSWGEYSLGNVFQQWYIASSQLGSGWRPQAGWRRASCWGYAPIFVNPIDSAYTVAWYDSSMYIHAVSGMAVPRHDVINNVTKVWQVGKRALTVAGSQGFGMSDVADANVS